jgi:hypothetical protein
MVTPAVDGIDLFKIAGRSISGWIPSFKAGTASPTRQPFCIYSQRVSMTILTLVDDNCSLSYPLGPGGGHVPVSIQDVKSLR